MASNKLIQLPNFSYTSLDFDTIIEDVQRLIKEHPEYYQNWDDFLESDAGRMFVESMAYVMEKQSSKTDWTARELFISTATQRQSLIELLTLINYKIKLPKASSVYVKAKLAKWVPSFNLPIRETVLGTDTKGNNIIFECLQMASDGKPDYDFQWTMETGESNNRIMEIYNIPFYQGTTVTDEDVYLDGIDNEKIELDSYPVIEKSIRVFSITRGGSELLEVASFISPEAQQKDVADADKLPPYQVSVDELNRAFVSFGPKSLVTTPNKGERLSIVYRVGGGENTNIVANAINQSHTYTIDNTRSTVIFTNPNAASGGADEEDLEQARLTGPLTLRTANKTVTHEDYIIHTEEHQSVMMATIVSKESEPKEIYEEYGYKLPPLDTWIYIVPVRSSWESIDPYEYNQKMLIGRPYQRHGVVDEETFVVDTLNQSVFLKKYKKNKGFASYVTLFEDTVEGSDFLAQPSYIEGIDFSIQSKTAEITRIAIADGGSMPDDTHTYKVRWIYDTTYGEDGLMQQESSVAYHYSRTVKTFENDGTIILDTSANSLYPNFAIVITDKTGNTTYVSGIDYTINWESGVVTRLSSGSISDNETVIIQFADKWVQDENDLSEETSILDSIADKKMVCVDNYIKDSLFTMFDVVATIYCHKNLRSRVQSGLKDYLRAYYKLDKSYYESSVLKADISKYIMDYEGVRFAEISYLGRDYHKYKKYVNDEYTLEELNAMGAENVEHKITAKYNEVLVLANDEYDGSELFDNQVHGLAFVYKDA